MDCRREHDRLERLAEKRVRQRANRQLVESFWDEHVTNLQRIQSFWDEHVPGQVVEVDSMMSSKEDRKMSDRTKRVLWAVGCFFAGALVAALFELMGG